MINNSNVFENLYQPKKDIKSKDGYLMLEDKEIVSYLGGNVKILNPSLSPFYVLRTKDVEGWICSRSIDTHRTNSRILRKAIRLSSTDEYDIAMSTYCATITDRYWFRPLGSNLTYDDIKFKSDKLSSIALDGKYTDVGKLTYTSPEFTNTGSFEKCWRLINDDWMLVKKAEPLSKFSELFVYRLGDYLKLNMARYLLDENREDVILSEDFTDCGSLIFEHMKSLIGDTEDYIENVKLLESLDYHVLQVRDNNDIIQEYLDILFLDTICMNVDRHTENYGFLRDSTDGRIISMAPNFDNNLSLVSNGVNLNRIQSPSRLIELFIEVCNYCPWYTIPVLEESHLYQITENCNDECGTDISTEYIASFVMNSYKAVINNVNNELRYT